MRANGVITFSNFKTFASVRKLTVWNTIQSGTNLSMFWRHLLPQSLGLMMKARDAPKMSAAFYHTIPATSQKTVTFIITAMRTSNLVK
jgi:hypothetical protein